MSHNSGASSAGWALPPPTSQPSIDRARSPISRESLHFGIASLIHEACEQYHRTKGPFMTKTCSLPGENPRYRRITTKEDAYTRGETAEALFEQSGLNHDQICALMGYTSRESLSSASDRSAGSGSADGQHKSLSACRLGETHCPVREGLYRRFCQQQREKGTTNVFGGLYSAQNKHTASQTSSRTGYLGKPLRRADEALEDVHESAIATYLALMVRKCQRGLSITQEEAMAARIGGPPVWVRDDTVAGATCMRDAKALSILAEQELAQLGTQESETVEAEGSWESAVALGASELARMDRADSGKKGGRCRR